MRTTVNIDDDLYNKAARFTGIASKTELLNLGLEEIIATYAAQQLAKMGGTMPNLKIPPRRDPWKDSKR